MRESPNAYLFGQSKSGEQKTEIDLNLVLADPQYNSKDHTISFKAKSPSHDKIAAEYKGTFSFRINGLTGWVPHNIDKSIRLTSGASVKKDFQKNSGRSQWFAIMAKSASYDHKTKRLTLKGVNKILDISERPFRDQKKHWWSMDKFIKEAWADKPDSFKYDPPNTFITGEDHKGHRSAHELVIYDPVYDAAANSLSFRIKTVVADKEFPTHLTTVSFSIDGIWARGR